MLSQIRADIEAGLRYIQSQDRFLTTILVGAILFNFSYLILPFLLLLGYYVYVIQSAIDDNEAPPRFHNWGGLLVDGTRATVVFFVYLLAPAALLPLFGAAWIGLPTSEIINSIDRVIQPQFTDDVTSLDHPAIDISTIIHVLDEYGLYFIGIRSSEADCWSNRAGAMKA